MAASSTDSTDAGSTPRGYTPPKGRPTRRNIDGADRTGLSATLEWIIVAIVLIAILGAIFYFGRGLGGGGGGGHNGAAVVSLVVAPILTG